MDSVKNFKILFPLNCRGLKCFKDDFSVYPFKDSSEFGILLVLKVKDYKKKKNFFEDNKSFLLIHVHNNKNSKAIRSVITSGQKQLYIYSFCISDEKIITFGNNSCLFNPFSWIADSKNVKCGRRSGPWVSLFTEEHSRSPQLTPLLSKLSLGSPEVMSCRVAEGLPWGLLVVVLGWSGRAPTPTLEAFDPAGHSWRYLPQEDFVCRAYCGVVLRGQELLVVGGFDGRRCRRSCLRFDGRRWHRAPPLRLPRCYVSAVALRGSVCALGGCDGQRRFRSCERLEDGRWEPFADMRRVRSDASAAVHQGRIFVSGGYDGERVLSCAEVYCALSDQWSLVAPPMASPRSGHALLSFQGRLWAIGGFDGQKRIRAVESLEEERGGWVPRRPLLHPRSNFGAAVLQEQLYVIGGYNGARTFAEVERLEGEGRGWRKARPLNKHRSAMGACVLVRAQDGCRADEPPVVQGVRVASP